MKQKKIDGNKSLWEIKLHSNPTVWECGRKYRPETDDHVEVNGKPREARYQKSAA